MKVSIGTFCSGLVVGGIICCSVYGIYDDMIGPHLRFPKEFGVAYPYGDAERFAVKPIIGRKLTELHDELVIYGKKLDTLHTELGSLPEEPGNDTLARLKAFKKYEQLQKEYRHIDARCYKIACDATAAGFRDVAIASGFPPRGSGSPF